MHKFWLKDEIHEACDTISGMCEDGTGAITVGICTILSPVWLPFWLLGKTIGAIAERISTR